MVAPPWRTYSYPYQDIVVVKCEYLPSTCEAWQGPRPACQPPHTCSENPSCCLSLPCLIPPDSNAVHKQKSSCQNQKRTQQKVMSISGFGRSFVRRYFTCGARRYSALRSTLIPDSNPASKTGRVLSLCLPYSIRLCKQAKRKANIRIPAGQRPVQLIYEQKQAKIFLWVLAG